MMVEVLEVEPELDMSYSRHGRGPAESIPPQISVSRIPQPGV